MSQRDEVPVARAETPTPRLPDGYNAGELTDADVPWLAAQLAPMYGEGSIVRWVLERVAAPTPAARAEACAHSWATLEADTRVCTRCGQRLTYKFAPAPPLPPAAGKPMTDERLNELRGLARGLWARELIAEIDRLRAARPVEGEDAEDAARWRALLACQRIRMMGGARLGTPTAHLGMEFWIQYDTDGYRSYADANASSIEELTRFVDLARAARTTHGGRRDAE